MFIDWSSHHKQTVKHSLGALKVNIEEDHNKKVILLIGMTMCYNSTLFNKDPAICVV